MLQISAPAELPKDFYVYLHRKASTGDVFYVGKGQANRAWKDAGRSKHWRNIQAKHGLVVEIVCEGLQEWASFELEQDLIALHGRRDCGCGPLVNLTDGGDGMSGWVPSDHIRQKIKYAAQARSKDPKWAAGHNARLQAMHADRDFRDRHNKKMKALAQNPEWIAKNKASVRATHNKSVHCVEIDQKFCSAADACDWLRANGSPKASASAISAACLGRRPRAYGYHWRYADAT